MASWLQQYTTKAVVSGGWAARTRLELAGAKGEVRHGAVHCAAEDLRRPWSTAGRPAHTKMGVSWSSLLLRPPPVVASFSLKHATCGTPLYRGLIPLNPNPSTQNVLGTARFGKPQLLSGRVAFEGFGPCTVSCSPS